MGSTANRRAAAAAAVGVLAVVAIAGAIAGVKVLQFATIGEAFASQVPPAERVNAVAVQRQEWQSRITSIGSVAAVQGTEVSTEADGVVREIAFEPGAPVAAGEVLVRLDDEVEQSQLRAAEAAAELARLAHQRARRLIAENAISRADLEQAEATAKQADAEVDNLRAIVAKKVVRAPFAGKLGIRRVSVGDYLAKGAPVVSLQSQDPVYVEFSLPQAHLRTLREGLGVAATVDAYPGEEFGGVISAVEPTVDSVTRNVRVQATFANAHGALRPGMFVAVDVALGEREPVNVVPATAVVHAPHGDSIFVIEPAAEPGSAPALVLRERPVELGARRGDYVVVTQGAAAGEQVVAAGVFKLREGISVVVDNSLAPSFALDPAPGDG